MNCDHPNCFKSSLLGLRQGIYYGAKIRFFHALVMTMLFRKGSLKDKIKLIIQLTYEHAKNLGLYVFLYKSTVCLLTKVRQKKCKSNNFLSGLFCGYIVFGRNQTAVNQQIVLYLLSRIIMGIASNLQRKGIIKTKRDFYPLLASMCWAIVMTLFNDDPKCLQNSLASSMTFLYLDSNQPFKFWQQIIPLEWPNFLSWK